MGIKRVNVYYFLTQWQLKWDWRTNHIKTISRIFVYLIREIYMQLAWRIFSRPLQAVNELILPLPFIPTLLAYTDKLSNPHTESRKTKRKWTKTATADDLAEGGCAGGGFGANSHDSKKAWSSSLLFFHAQPNLSPRTKTTMRSLFMSGVLQTGAVAMTQPLPHHS